MYKNFIPPFFCGKIYIKHKIYHFNKYAVQWHQVHSCCTAITTIHLQSFLIIPNWNSALTPHLSFPTPRNMYSTFWLYEFDYFRYLIISRIMEYFSFCHWLISLSIMSSRLSMLQHIIAFIFVYGWIIFHCIYNHISVIHSPISWHLDYFHLI